MFVSFQNFEWSFIYEVWNHLTLICDFQALKTLPIREAIVIGPIPFGTGE